jgi:hypothetical protein
VLFSIALRHGFHADERCPGLAVRPTASTRALIERAGGVLRTTADGVALLVDGAAIDRLPCRGDTLAFVLCAQEAGFVDRTAALGHPGREALFFDAARAVPDAATGALRLHAGDTAAAADLRRLDDGACRGLWGPSALAAHRPPPLGVVCLPLAALAAAAAAPPCFVIRFAPRATIWQYCLVGEWSEPSLQVVDATPPAPLEPVSTPVRFESAPPRRLVDGREALVFRSNRPIALREHPREHFELRSSLEARSPGQARADRILVRRLPAAAARHFSREVIAGAPALVSEIFVHR